MGWHAAGLGPRLGGRDATGVGRAWRGAARRTGGGHDHRTRSTRDAPTTLGARAAHTLGVSARTARPPTLTVSPLSDGALSRIFFVCE
eukprot:scaffold7574_cov68-Phaeocystis_antarctica.AAC.8